MKRQTFDTAAFEEALEARGLGVADFANAAGISRHTIYKWLQGTRAPKPSYYKRVIDTLGVESGTFLVTKAPDERNVA